VTETNEHGTQTAGGVRLEIDRSIAVITIDRPEKRNAIGFRTVVELNAALDEALAAEPAVLVITGGGDRAFVSGGDLKELAAVRTHDDAYAMASDVRALLDRIAEFPVPVIAAINGTALGGGAETAVAADIRIAADDIKLGFNQVSLAIMPAWGGAERLAKLIGPGRAMLAISTSRIFDAASAEAWGLVDIVVPREEFDSRWRALAAHIAALAPGASRSIKAVVSAAEPRVHRELEDAAKHHFAALWAADAHWDAVENLTKK
jgi:enoyl-CoA hydratase/carnithine racemase